MKILKLYKIGWMSTLSTIASALILVLPTLSWAAEHEVESSGEPVGIPISVVYQGINFFIFAGLGYYFLRHPIRTFFNGRRENFRQALIKAEHARREAEMHKNEIQERLTKLEMSSQTTMAEARAEADALRSRILQEAADLSKNFREEANRTVQSELDRAKSQLRDEVLTQSLIASKKMLTDKMNEPDQKRLQTEFVEKIADAQSNAEIR